MNVMWNRLKNIFGKSNDCSSDTSSAEEIVVDVEHETESVSEPAVESALSESIVGEKSFGKPLADAIATIISELGTGILLESKLINIVADYNGYCEIPASKKILESVMQDSDYSKLIDKNDDSDCTNLSHSICYTVSQKNGYKEDLVWKVIVNILVGIGKVNVDYIESYQCVPSIIDNQCANDQSNKDCDAESEPYKPELDLENYLYPTYDNDRTDINLSDDEIKRHCECVANIFNCDRIKSEFIGVSKGHVVSVYNFKIDSTKQLKLQRRSTEIASYISSNGARIIPKFNNDGNVEIEIPNDEPAVVPFIPTLSTTNTLEVYLGELAGGKGFGLDISQAPHIAILGNMFTGKTSLIRTMMTSLLMYKHPAALKFVIVSFGSAIDYSDYEMLENHFLAKIPGDDNSIVINANIAVHTLNSIRLEIDARYNLLQDAHARNIVEYNEKFVNRKLDPGRGHSYRPKILVIIDEIMPLLQNASDFNLNDYFNKILALAHIVGVHFVVSSKYADSNTLSILGRLFATRIVFQTNKNLSREIVGNDDSVNLLPCGDALCFMNGSAVRFQPTLLDCDKGYDMVKQIANQRGYPTPYYLPDDNCNEESDSEINVGILDPLLEDVARLIIRQQFPSTSFVQRKFGLGYNRAARLMDQLEKIGVVGPIKGAMPREFLVVDEVELENKLQHIYSNSCKR